MVTEDDVQIIAKLARLEFKESEVDAYTTDLNNVLGYIDQLKEVDVTGVAPLENVNETVELNDFRKDEFIATTSRDEALKNAPKAADGYFLVPKVIEQGKGTVSVDFDEDIEEM
jgi:aspartyl-tRNA(Asn)/glutamyl-tRNA(Gln) amidotransferase subunit C